jgi:Right handed beta helix region
MGPLRATLVLTLLVGCGGDEGPPTDGDREVYPGCEAPATEFLRTVTLDPANGDTLAEAVAGKALLPGDHVVLLPGDHGAVLASKFVNPELVDAEAWIWIDAQAGATLQRLEVRDLSRWLLTGLEITNTSGHLLAFGSASEIVVTDSDLYTTRDTSAFTADDWIDGVASGISVRNGRCLSLLRNQVTNVRFGISVSSDAKTVAENRVDVLARGNRIKNFSGDGMRPIASNIRFADNDIIDSYVSDADGDGNHDDGIQGFALDGAVYDNVVIEGAWVQETTDPTRAFNASLQGIAVFDGLYTNMSVQHNVVLTSAYHGISLFGPTDSIIAHNTVVGIDPARKLWISAPVSKEGVAPVNTVFRDNIASTYMLDAGVTDENNHTVLTPDASTHFVKFDLATATFDLHLKPSSPIANAAAGRY